MECMLRHFHRLLSFRFLKLCELMSKLSEEEIEKEKHFIVAMDMPHYPFLPVIKRDEMISGIIIAGDNIKLPLKVYVCNLFGLKDDGVNSIEQLRKKYECREFKTLDEFLDSGWKVD